MGQVRLADDDIAALEKAAALEQRSIEEVLHSAVQEYTSGWRRHRDQLVDEILHEDAAMLRKLGAT